MNLSTTRAPSACLIELNAASYRYTKAKTHVFSDLDLIVTRGEQIALVGPSGGGKSTLLYALSAMLRLSTGSYRFEGESIQTMQHTELDRWHSSHVGFVYQQAALLPHLSLLDNVLLPVAHERAKKTEWKERASGLLESLGLAELANRLPSAVSGGQAQRAAIARAIMRSPALVLADEPTSALDDEAAANVMEILQTACAGTTTLVLATHDSRLLSASTRVVQMSELAGAAAMATS